MKASFHLYFKTGILKVLFGLILFSLAANVRAQGGETYEGKEIIDTLKINNSTIILFADKTWMYVSDPNFDGVMNEYLHNIIMNDTSLNFKNSWNTGIPFTYDNDINRLKDTLWLCTVDSTYNKFCMPVEGDVLSKFKYRGSRFHHGVDIDLDIGDTVRAAFSGKVRYAQYNKGGFGNLVIIRHYNGLETYYAHLSKINVVPDQEITAGEVIGLGGNTGRSYGPHLHFETRFYDNAFDPYEIIDFDNKRLRSENLFIHPGMFDYRAVSRANTQQKVLANGNVQTYKPAPLTTDSKGAKYYSVHSGDTLSSIAVRYGTTINHLCELNGISRNSILQIGQKLRVK